MEGKEKDHTSKNRFKSLFSKEKKPPLESEGNLDDFLRGSFDSLRSHSAKHPATSSQELDDFLHGPSDKLFFATPDHSLHPPLTRIDTSAARRWPSAAEVKSSNIPRSQSTGPKRNKKGLVVRFTDERPIIIGEGGDEADLPTLSLRQRAQTHPPDRPRSREIPPRTEGIPTLHTHGAADTWDFRPGPLQRAQTGFESVSDAPNGPSQSFSFPPLEQSHIGPTQKKTGEHHDPKSFAARVRAEMRAGEGMALVHAASDSARVLDELEGSPEISVDDAHSPKNASRLKDENTTDRSHASNDFSKKLTISNEAPENFRNESSNTQKVHGTPPSTLDAQKLKPALSIRSQLNSGTSSTPQAQNVQKDENLATLSRTSPLNLHDAAVAVGDDALREHSARVAHLFNIFLLSAEVKRPVSECSLEDFTRAALWWFLKGRSQLESTIRDRPTSPGAQQNSLIARQQAYADLAKSLWIFERIMPQYPEVIIPQRDPHMVDILDTRNAIMSSLRKLTMSMKRNNILPPATATLPQGLDTSIWIEDEGKRSLLTSQKQAALTNFDEYLPLGDTNRTFHYGRAFARAGLIEDVETQVQDYRFPVLVSILRGSNQAALSAVITSQDGTFKICVQSNKSLGPTWENVTWNSKLNIIDIALPRGFLLRVHCSYQDFCGLRGIYDYQKQIHGGMVRQQDEELVFETFLKSFQYFDPDPASNLPKESFSNCRLRLFEKIVMGKAASGTRRMHRGFRIGLVTSPGTKNLRGLNQELSPILPMQLGFLRSDDGSPTLLLSVHNDKHKYRVVFTFEDANERIQLHARLIGITLGDREAIVMESQVTQFSVSKHSQSVERDLLKALDWRSIKVINEEPDDLSSPKTALSTNLRVVTDFQSGTFTDRINIGPGELKIRLDAKTLTDLQVHRHPQQDMTISVSESQVPKALFDDLTDLLVTIATSETTRTYNFPTIQELHLFQVALTGFSVLFDGTASSLNISRRRMVVPIYKKLDATLPRLQLVQREGVTQLVAFFENFIHGECMNFALKSTDIFETSSRHGKQTLRIVDAKFAMPKTKEAAADASFVCLDMLEYPSEHDDITIIFDDETEFEKFTKALPAPVKIASRMPSVRR